MAFIGASRQNANVSKKALLSQKGCQMQVTAREKIDFGLDDSIARWWFAGDAYKTRVVDGFQLTFPDGERYFINSVRKFRDGVEDPGLLADVKGFIRQEGQHGMQHMGFNELLKKQGVPVDAILHFERMALGVMEKRFSPQFNLALTTAFEHFTALLADAFFANKRTLEGADERIKALLGWHAIEEMEHRHVAFDVYVKSAKGGYFMRIGAMTLATAMVVVAMYRLSDILLKVDGFGPVQRVALHVKNLPWLFGRKGLFTRMIPKILSFYRPSFHPSKEKDLHNYPDWLAAWNETQDPMQAFRAMHAAAK
jgi:predicted metal-dependent hydrolase